MAVFLNAFPLKIPDAELEALQVPYDKEALDDLRAKHGSTHSFRRQGDNILIFSADGTFPVSGTSRSILLNENFGIFCSLVKDGLTRHFTGLGRSPSGFNPIELVSTRPKTIFWPRFWATHTRLRSAPNTQSTLAMCRIIRALLSIAQHAGFSMRTVCFF